MRRTPRCQGVTVAGDPCGRLTRDPSGLCPRHRHHVETPAVEPPDPATLPPVPCPPNVAQIQGRLAPYLDGVFEARPWRFVIAGRRQVAVEWPDGLTLPVVAPRVLAVMGAGYRLSTHLTEIRCGPDHEPAAVLLVRSHPPATRVRSLLRHLDQHPPPPAPDENWAWTTAKRSDLTLGSMTDPDRWLPHYDDLDAILDRSGRCNGGIDTIWLARIALDVADERNTV